MVMEDHERIEAARGHIERYEHTPSRWATNVRRRSVIASRAGPTVFPR
jgi:hypothetical protein